ncbi:hypothetical protein GQ54DRAFT_304339 [Martensiomyces pterosporus]|nr:hypothetical protein GQ54DRAFT_304339 [Martensiomyces pterosporus]
MSFCSGQTTTTVLASISLASSFAVIAFILYLRFKRSWQFTTFMTVCLMMSLSAAPSMIIFLLQQHFYKLPECIQNSEIFIRVVFGYLFYGHLPLLYLFSSVIFTMELLFRSILRIVRFKIRLRWSVPITYALSHLLALPMLFVRVYVQDCILSPVDDDTSEWVAITFYLYLMVFGICAIFVTIALTLSCSRAILMYRQAKRLRTEALAAQPEFVRDLYFGQVTRLNMYYVLLYPALLMLETVFMSTARIFTLPTMMTNRLMINLTVYPRVLTGLVDFILILISPAFLHSTHRAVRHRASDLSSATMHAHCGMREKEWHRPLGKRLLWAAFSLLPAAMVRGLSKPSCEPPEMSTRASTCTQVPSFEQDLEAVVVQPPEQAAASA